MLQIPCLKSPLQQLVPTEAKYREIAAIQKVHQKHNEDEIKRVLSLAIHERGPVHLNIPMKNLYMGCHKNPFNFLRSIKKPSSKKNLLLLMHWRARGIALRKK